ncbi:PREDICTED: uncharacterized protein LOC105362396 [Ceratosolen solmsi marchali]|uniref:Uncharacterized protein LOC105362396 n=1 Tax=Ceratosolen solmsi marchali TaxID=326594 RepID=A0AAJ6YHG3_9HYME|nr:PREDICTED: uncharacterized protein LOC105362396 [Ceratosolen solmsi marchali]
MVTIEIEIELAGITLPETRPFPMVPEVSLIWDKPSQSTKINDNLPNTMPELRIYSEHDTNSKGSESYAAWKEKQFPQQTSKISSSNLNKPYTSHNKSLQDNYRQAIKSERRDNRRDEKRDEKRDERQDEEKDEQRNERRNERRDVQWEDTDIYDDRRYYDHVYNEDCHIPHKSKIHRSSSHSNVDHYLHRSIPMEYECKSKHSRSLQPIHCSPEHSHNCSGCCSLNQSKSSRDTETVKNLLQVITSQNEQIKNLQKQLERVLKLYEQNIKDHYQCPCHSGGIVYQNTQLYDQSQTTNLPIPHNNLVKDNEKNLSDKTQHEKTKQTILEQKVSIGVMTSFELKVQNNPSLGIDNDTKQKNNHEKVVSSLETSNMIKNLVNDTGEMIRKKQNIFTPTPLENISEGSESHISSFRQSHLYSDSIRPIISQDSSEAKNANYYKYNVIKETDNVKKKGESKRYTVATNDKNIRYTSNLDYDVNEPIFKDTFDDNEEETYEYNLPYEDLPSLAEKKKKTDDFNVEPILNDIIKTKNIKFDQFADECLSLSSSELDLEEPNPPSPEPSIHVDLQEYSSENGSLPPQRSAKVGWTLYNNVVDQVNQILQNSPLNNNSEQEASDGMRNMEKKEIDNNVIMDTVKAATLEQLTKLGISFSDNVEQREPHSNKKVAFDTSYYSRQIPDTHVVTTSASIETNTSLHMKALAMKYLNDEQLGDIAFQKPRLPNLKQGHNNIQNTNMSFATMHYLQRYHLLPGTNSNHIQETRLDEHHGQGPVINERLVMKAPERREASPHRYLPLTGSSKISYPSKILDISTLKQQPKLL